MTDDTTRTVKTTATSFRVLEALRDREPAGVSELARELDLSKGTVHKHLATLRDLRYVVQEPAGYRLGLGFLGLGVVTRRRLEVFRVARRPLERLSSATEAVASLMIPEHGRGVYVARVPFDDDVQLPHYEGEHVSLHATAGGKAILSCLPAAVRTDIVDEHGLPAVTPHTITDPDVLADELRTISDTRIAYDRGEQVEGWECVASPITDDSGVAVGALTVSSPSASFSQRGSQDIPGLVLSSANSVENKLQFGQDLQ
jgi:DNA-binding IclR family transcriptional regulator